MSSLSVTLSTGVSALLLLERDLVRKAGWIEGGGVSAGVLGKPTALAALSTGLPLAVMAILRCASTLVSREGTGGAGVCCFFSRLPENKSLIFSSTYLLLERPLGVC